MSERTKGENPSKPLTKYRKYPVNGKLENIIQQPRNLCLSIQTYVCVRVCMCIHLDIDSI